ncbi:MAG: DUF3656 domain-containing protein, partial [Lachnospiraceae bacterium]|nr:DUF3656 domain-containing protein [Lachnospiraceae bacterium]
SGVLRAVPGEPLSLTCEIFGCSVTVSGNVVSPAQSKPSSAEDMEAVLRKTGESIFDFSTIRTETTGDAFVPVGALKSIRREVFEKLKDEVIKKHLRTVKDPGPAEKEAANSSEKASAKTMTVFSVSAKEQLETVTSEVSAGEAEIWLDLQEDDLSEQIKIYDETSEKGYLCYLVLPHIFRKKDALRFEKDLDLKHVRVIVNSFDELAFVLAHEEIKGFKLSGSVYVMNNRTEKVLQRICGSALQNALTASLELNSAELKRLDLTNAIFQIYGRIPLMYTAQCVRDNYLSCLKVKGKRTDIELKDQKNACFPVRTACSTCLNIIYNSKIYSLLTSGEDGRYVFSDLDPGAVLLSFTFEDAEETRNVIRSYKEGRELTGHAYTRGTFNRLVE